jgi:cyclopropane fatty-acyl-phospholipid synthase-like methyltransferase
MTLPSPESLLSVRPAYAGSSADVHRRVAEYFDRTQYLYSIVWSRSALHYGFWEPGTRRLEEAIQNVNRFVAMQLEIPRGGRVLDAGCGVGGTSLFLAERHGLRAVGVSLSREQLKRARRYADRSTAEHRPQFALADYAHTGFPSASFDGIFAIESACHAPSKLELLREARRLLRPGGRLVVIDGFVAKTELDERERRHLLRLMNGFALPHMAGVEAFHADLIEAGFSSVRCLDKTEEILPSARLIAKMSWPGLATLGAFCWIGLLPQVWLAHALACLSQKHLFTERVSKYCAFVATAP